jgi:hypothetical protein
MTHLAALAPLAVLAIAIAVFLLTTRPPDEPKPRRRDE